jgi:hypothetical protein
MITPFCLLGNVQLSEIGKLKRLYPSQPSDEICILISSLPDSPLRGSRQETYTSKQRRLCGGAAEERRLRYGTVGVFLPPWNLPPFPLVHYSHSFPLFLPCPRMSLLASKTEEADKASLFSVTIDNDHTKDETKPPYPSHLTVQHGTTLLRISSPDAFSEFSIEDDGRGRRSRSVSIQPPRQRYISKSPARPLEVKGWGHAFWKRNKGLALVLLAQVFGTLMNVTTRYGSLHRKQILNTAIDMNGIGFSNLRATMERACIHSR